MGVGVASPVPNAVVIPTTIPEVGSGKTIGSSEAGAAPLVGRTTLLGTPPVEPTTGSGEGSGVGVGVGSGARGARIEERRPSEAEDVGCRTDSGTPPVEPGTMKGPRKLDDSTTAGASDTTGVGVGVGVTMTSGSPPVEETTGLGASEGSITSCAGSDEVGRTAEEGTPPVDPTSPPRRDDRKPPTGGSAEGVGVGVADGRTSGISLETGVLTTSEEDGCTMTSGKPPVDAGAEFGGAELGGTMTSGWSSGISSGASGLGVGTGDEDTITSGMRPVGTTPGGGSTTSSEDEDETGGDGSRRFPVPVRRLFGGSGLSVTMTSCTEVTVVAGSASLLLTMPSEEGSGRDPNRDSTNELKSGNSRD